MDFILLLLTAVGLSMDAFAVAICSGLAMRRATLKNSLIVGLYFGVFQGIMPLAGYMLAMQFAEKIIVFDHWVAFILLSIIGGKMIYEGSKKEGCSDGQCTVGEACNTNEASLRPSKMLPLAIATSIDALAVGVSFAFLQVDIIPAVFIIGTTTLILSMVGVKIGNVFGVKFKSKAELVGGTILVLIGLKILLEHLDIIRIF